MSGLKGRMEAAKQAAPKPAEKGEPKRHHVREVWDGAIHGIGAALKAFAFYVLIVGGGGAVLFGSYYFLSAQRMDTAIDVLMLLDLTAPETEAAYAVQNAVFRRAEAPPIQVDLLWRAYAITGSLIYWTAVLARPGRRG